MSLLWSFPCGCWLLLACAANEAHASPLRLRKALQPHPAEDSFGAREQKVLKRMQWWSTEGSPQPPTDKFLLFSLDSGGLNNIRMGWEMTGLVAQYTGRTLVLPPPHPIYLLDWGRRVTGFLPDELSHDNTSTLVDDLLNVQQLKTVLPTLTWREFHERTGIDWDQAVKEAAALKPEQLQDCQQLTFYAEVHAKLLYMDGGDRREGFNCAQWWSRGGPKPALAREIGDAGFALLTHGFMWHEDAFRIAAKVVNYLGLFNYVALHARYNDFDQNFGKQPTPQSVLDNVSPVLSPGTVLYIASDEPEKFKDLDVHGARLFMWKDLFEDKTGGLLVGERAHFGAERWFKLTGPVEELICTFAKVFVGRDRSSFSGHISAMRLQADAPVSWKIVDTEEFPAEEVKMSIQLWNSKGGADAFAPLPRTKGNVFFLQVSMS